MDFQRTFRVDELISNSSQSITTSAAVSARTGLRSRIWPYGRTASSGSTRSNLSQVQVGMGIGRLRAFSRSLSRGQVRIAVRPLTAEPVSSVAECPVKSVSDG